MECSLISTNYRSQFDTNGYSDTCRFEHPDIIQNARDAEPSRFGTDGSEVDVQLINYLIINLSRGKSSCSVRQRIETRAVVISQGASFSRVLLP